MGRKNILNKYPLLVDVDGSASQVSNPTSCSGIDKITYDLSVDGSLTGEAIVQYCNDEKIQPSSDWKDLDFGEQISIDAGSETDYKIELDISFRWLRVLWTPGSGSGSLSLDVYGTTVGA